ncbi:MAG: hypothetical protein H7Y59_01120 [Anaerolineales bacterium]|nr:hypothetical protein [Anaerolineales bacterium]
MAHIIANNPQINFQITDKGKDVEEKGKDFKDVKSGPNLQGPGPLFENQYEQCLTKTGKEIEKRTRKLTKINKSLSEFLTTFE